MALMLSSFSKLTSVERLLGLVTGCMILLRLRVCAPRRPDVVPVAVTATRLSKLLLISVRMATLRTISSQSLQSLVDEIADGCGHLLWPP